jgi:hypothetical protein
VRFTSNPTSVLEAPFTCPEYSRLTKPNAAGAAIAIATLAVNRQSVSRLIRPSLIITVPS